MPKAVIGVTESAAKVPSYQKSWCSELGAAEYYRQNKEKLRGGGLPFDRLKMQLSPSPYTVKQQNKAAETVGRAGPNQLACACLTSAEDIWCIVPRIMHAHTLVQSRSNAAARSYLLCITMYE